MRPGNLTRWAGTFATALSALALALPAVAPAGSANVPKTTTTISSPSPAGGAIIADAPIIFMIQGTEFPTRITAVIGPAGRLTLVSPEGITAPVTAMGECTQDSPIQVSCLPDYVDIIAGDLRAGADTFTAGSELRVLIGSSVPGIRIPLLGGVGRDRITGGALTDTIDGGPGADILQGNASSDLIRGGAGRDRINGRLGSDALFGGGGADAINGGGGRDLCVGGGGRDKARNCFVSKKIP